MDSPRGMDAHPNYIKLASTVYDLFRALTRAQDFDADHGLGGKLVLAGDLSCRGGYPDSDHPLADASQAGALVCAANIAGAATLVACSDPADQRQAMREGVIDFLVTNLDEALRILKNEIRKRETVSVCVQCGAEALLREVVARGVLPDCLAPAGFFSARVGNFELEANLNQIQAQGAIQLAVTPESGSQFTAWFAPTDPTRWLPILDALVLAGLREEDAPRKRWLSRSPRYLGKDARRYRSLVLTPQETAEFRFLVRKGIQEGAVPDGIALFP